MRYHQSAWDHFLDAGAFVLYVLGSILILLIAAAAVVVGVAIIVFLATVGLFIQGWAVLWVPSLFGYGPGPGGYWFNVLVGFAVDIILGLIGGVLRRRT